MSRWIAFLFAAALITAHATAPASAQKTRRHLQFVGTSDLNGDPSFTGDVDVDASGGVAYVGAAFTERAQPSSESGPSGAVTICWTGWTKFAMAC